MDWSPLRSLVHPERAFSDAPRLRWAVVVVLLVGLLNVGMVVYSAGFVADATTGSVEIDNPDRPSAGFCEQSDPGEFFDHYHDECANEPETITRSLSTYAAETARGLAPLAFLSTIAAWVAVSGVAAVTMGATTRDDPDDRVSFASVLAVTGLGFAPAALRYVARGLIVKQSVAVEGLAPATIDGARAAAVDAMTPQNIVYTAVVVATLAWSAYVWRGGWRAVFDTDDRRVTVLAVVSATLLAVQAWAPVYVASWPYAIIFFVIGLPALVFPRAMERIDLAFDLIGTRGADDVELRPWRVGLKQAGGLVVVGLASVVLGALLFA